MSSKKIVEEAHFRTQLFVSKKIHKFIYQKMKWSNAQMASIPKFSPFSKNEKVGDKKGKREREKERGSESWTHELEERSDVHTYISERLSNWECFETKNIKKNKIWTDYIWCNIITKRYHFSAKFNEDLQIKWKKMSIFF